MSVGPVPTISEYFKDGYILVVDGNTNVRKNIRSMLKYMGISNVREAADGNIALRVMGGQDAKCLFVLTEWDLPKMSGIEMGREIRANGQVQDTPIFIITGDGNRENIVQAGEAGINFFMIKPFIAKALEEKILHTIRTRANPPEHVKLIKAAEELIRRGETSRALAVFEEVCRTKESGRALVSLGETHELLGNNPSAHSSYSRAMDLQPLFLKAYMKAASLYLRTDDQKAGIYCLERAAELSPNNTERNLLLGKLYLQQGEPDKANGVYARVCKLEPARSGEVAEEMLKAGATNLAEQYFRISLGDDSTSIHIYNQLGIALRRQGKWKDAITEYEKALKIDPNDEALYFNMAKACLEGNNKEAARKYFSKVLQIDPDNEDAKRELGAIGRDTTW